MISEFNPNESITMTDSAINHAIKTLRKFPGSVGMRLTLKKTGCSGYSYVTEESYEIHDDDLVFDQSDGLRVIVSKSDFPLVSGTNIDFSKEGLNSVFKFHNPNATGECGCGESFST